VISQIVSLRNHAAIPWADRKELARKLRDQILEMRS